jgi:hypothetical protein
MKAVKLIPCIAIAVFLAGGAMNGCTKKPNKDETVKLDEAKNAAEDAEKKLYDLKQERMKLEAEKQKTQKQDEEK